MARVNEQFSISRQIVALGAPDVTSLLASAAENPPFVLLLHDSYEF